ncbi:hypothetical protein BZG36_04736 [Bifiguratus adelaidae]|uniref:Thioesterase domain-containing protein n=1 Tax=Bifiguratus adelaidae TaxID=1938954 RepID=A0A261XUR4_9FUNG|nr:hypothetical protein BZG36_04736 [Bifiguratus adelaidae]
MSHSIPPHAVQATGPFRWLDVSTPLEYFETLCIALDRSREKLFDIISPKLQILSAERGVTTAGMLVRAVKIHLVGERLIPRLLDQFVVEARIVRAGKTSFGIEHAIWYIPSNAPQRSPLLLAMATTTMVSVDMASFSPMHMPDGLFADLEIHIPTNEIIIPLKDFPTCWQALHSAAPIPKGLPSSSDSGIHSPSLYTHAFQTRSTDCDFLNHVTNTRYISLYADAIQSGYEMHRSAVPYPTAQVGRFEVEYDREVGGWRDTRIVVWFENGETLPLDEETKDLPGAGYVGSYVALLALRADADEDVIDGVPAAFAKEGDLRLVMENVNVRQALEEGDWIVHSRCRMAVFESIFDGCHPYNILQEAQARL